MDTFNPKQCVISIYRFLLILFLALLIPLGIGCTETQKYRSLSDILKSGEVTVITRIKTRLPKYDRIIQEAAEKNGFDWRLIAAQIYQESHFNPRAQSPKGAYGLMQLTPSMAESFGIKDILDAEQNVEAGTRYLRDLYDYFDKATPPDRLYLALAAYNIGLGHIWDARDLAREHNLDPNKWSSLLQTLPLLKYHKYNKNLRFGYAKGTEPIHYTQQIMIYYDILKRQSIENQT